MTDDVNFSYDPATRTLRGILLPFGELGLAPGCWTRGVGV